MKTIDKLFKEYSEKAISFGSNVEVITLDQCKDIIEQLSPENKQEFGECYTREQVLTILNLVKNDLSEEAYECVMCEFGHRQTQETIMSINMEKYLS